MSDTSNGKERCVAGFVKFWPNNDGSTTFKIAEGALRLTLSDKNEHAKALRSARRVLVRYEGEGRSLKVSAIIPNPSSRLIRQHMEQCKP